MRQIPIAVWFIVPTLILVVGGVVLFSRSGNQTETPAAEEKSQPAAVASQVEGVEEIEIMGRDHVPAGGKHEYNSNPPTSGPHTAGHEESGIYDKEIPDEQMVHNLEHGHVWISYKGDASPEVIEELKKIVSDDGWKVMLTKRDANDSKIAVAAWGRLLKMDEPDYNKIRDFIKTYRNRGPEKTAE